MKNLEKNHSVYALVKQGKCVYVGCSQNVHQRKIRHKKDKDFDSVVILKSRIDKKTALAVEKGLIEFLTYFGSGEWYNAEKILSKYEKLYLRGEI